jgi:hypothetical protein
MGFPVKIARIEFPAAKHPGDRSSIASCCCDRSSQRRLSTFSSYQQNRGQERRNYGSLGGTCLPIHLSAKPAKGDPGRERPEDLRDHAPPETRLPGSLPAGARRSPRRGADYIPGWERDRSRRGKVR